MTAALRSALDILLFRNPAGREPTSSLPGHVPARHYLLMQASREPQARSWVAGLGPQGR